MRRPEPGAEAFAWRGPKPGSAPPLLSAATQLFLRAAAVLVDVAVATVAEPVRAEELTAGEASGDVGDAVLTLAI